MTRGKWRAGRLVVAGLLLVGLTAAAELRRSQFKDSLRDLKGVYVLAQLGDLHPEGLATNTIERRVKEKLGAAGIRVDPTPNQFHGSANLCVTVDTVRAEELGVYLFTVEVALLQEARLTRLPHAPSVAAQTWGRKLQGLTTPDQIDAIQKGIDRCIDSFIADYRSVNPEEATPRGP
jgi:hypothetical protein